MSGTRSTTNEVQPSGWNLTPEPGENPQELGPICHSTCGGAPSGLDGGTNEVVNALKTREVVAQIIEPKAKPNGENIANRSRNEPRSARKS